MVVVAGVLLQDQIHGMVVVALSGLQHGVVQMVVLLAPDHVFV